MGEFTAGGEWQQQPEGETAGDGVPREPEDPRVRLLRWIREPNIAAELSEEELGGIGARVKNEWEIDEQSRSDWRKKVEDAVKLAMQVSEPKNYPWPKASSIVYPLMTTAAMQFAARAYPAIIANRAVVKGVVLGRDDGTPLKDPTGAIVSDPQTGGPAWQIPPGALQARADRIGSHMSWQLLEEMPEWEPETDRLLHQLPIVGSLFRKSYFDPARGRNMSLTVPALKLVVNYWAKSLALAPRVTEEVEFYPYEIREFERAGLWLERRYSPSIDGEKSGALPDADAPITFLEQHRWLDLDDDNYPEPYTVTTDKEGSQVVRIVARFDEEGLKFGTDGRVLRIEPLQYYTQYDFLPSLDGGVYGTGFGQLLGPINAGVNTTLNMLLDAGHLANTNGGFIAKNLSMQAGTLRWTMGEFKPVNAAAGMPLRDSIMPLPFAGPSQVLFMLLGTLIDAGKDVASIKDVMAGDQPQANVPATTTLALIEQGQKVFTAIYKRVFRSLKAELEKLKRLNRIFMPESQDFRVAEKWFTVTRADYLAGAGVEPVSDPNMVSDAQMLGRAQFLMQGAFVNNPLIVQPELLRRLLKAASIDEIDKLMNPNPSPPPQVVMKGLDLEIDGRKVASLEMLQKAQSLQALTQAALNLAKADQAVGEEKLAWVEQQFSAVQQQFEQAMSLAQLQQDAQANAAGNGNGSGGSPGAGGAQGPGSGADAAPVPPVAPSPGLEGPVGLPGGPPSGPAGNAS